MIDYRYPEEKAALHELVRKKEFQAALKLFEKIYADATDFARLQGRNFRVTKAAQPRLHYLYRLAARRLEFREEVPMYLELSHQFAPKIYGTDGKCAVVLSSICLETLTDPELMAMFGSAISHIQHGHVKYLNMGNLADELFLSIPFVGSAAAMMVKALLVQWRKYAEFTADRGAAVAAGDAQAVFGYLSKSMGNCVSRLAEGGAPPSGGVHVKGGADGLSASGGGYSGSLWGSAVGDAEGVAVLTAVSAVQPFPVLRGDGGDGCLERHKRSKSRGSGKTLLSGIVGALSNESGARDDSAVRRRKLRLWSGPGLSGALLY